MTPKKLIGELLVEQGIINQEQLEQALQLQQRGKRFLGQILIGMGWGNEFDIYKALSKSLRVRFVSFDDFDLEPQIVKLIPPLLAVTRDILPFAVEDNTLYLVMENPRDIDVIQLVEFTTERQVKPLIAPLSQLREMIRRAYNIKIGTSIQPERPDELERLGLSREDLKKYRQLLRQPHGLVLVVGPTGSGKTTTLYASLKKIQEDPARNIVTIEDPIEYQLQGIKQIQINEEVGLTFTSVLSLIHDQFPEGQNVVMVGELRDADTAQVVTRVTETGHLVLSSLHTNDAVSTVTHLFHLGIPADLVASDLLGVLAQRVVREICPRCKMPYHPDTQELRSIGLADTQVTPFVAYKGRGCEKCEGTGYYGQIGLYEFWGSDEKLREQIAQQPTRHKLRQIATTAGMKTLLEDGISKVRQSLTTIAEVARVCCVTCPGCGNALPETENTCPFCHYRLHETCGQCGAKLELEWRLCPFCGTSKSSG